MQRPPDCITYYDNGFITLGERDPIEGAKMQTQVQCPRCKRQRILHLHTPEGKAAIDFWATLKREQDAAQAREQAAREERARLRQSGLQKLSPAERHALELPEH
jgi:hypothetical protein